MKETCKPEEVKDIWAAYIDTAIEEIFTKRRSYLDVRWDLRQPENCLDEKQRREILLKIAAGVHEREIEIIGKIDV